MLYIRLYHLTYEIYLIICITIVIFNIRLIRYYVLIFYSAFLYIINYISLQIQYVVLLNIYFK